MAQLCGHVLIYKTKRPSTFACTLPPGHTPAERRRGPLALRRLAAR